MNLQTKIPLKKATALIDYGSQLLLLGSCFSNNIGHKLAYFKFQNVQNPFGILFHPMAIENLIQRAIRREKYTEKEVFFENERWHCFDAHSELSAGSKETLLKTLNSGLETVADQLSKATHIFITLGTAWVYRHLKTNQVVANCHKVPQREFTKELLSADKIQRSLENSVQSVQAINKTVQCVFTISPIRHLKDGFIENQRSKAHLISAVHSLIASPSAEKGQGKVYFGSYEIMMDELRDYRFYERDMIHPNQLAIDYIWEKFKSVWIVESAYETMAKVEEVQKGLAHRPFNKDSQQHNDFQTSLGKKITYLQQGYGHMTFDE